jgi:glutamate-1-semialdehyde 2,1-aminomutase
MNSNELFERSKKVTPGGVHSPVRAFRSVGGNPVFFKSAQGAYLTSVEGNRYLDFCQSFGPNILGHRDPEIQTVLETAIKDAWSFGACEPYSLALAEWVNKNVPWVEKIRFVSSGTEAVMSALRVAKAATGRPLILKFEGCYHGHSDPLLVKAGSGLAGEAASDSAGVDQQTASQTLVVPLNDEAAIDRIFNDRGREIAAIILEPLPANFGLLEQRPEFLKHVSEAAKKAGALVIYDEVISGFRVGVGGMAERLKIKPDLVTFGKVLGGGFPVGAYAGRSDLMSQVAPEGPVYQAGTLSANPIGMRVGLATLEKCVRDDVYGKLEKRTRKFTTALNEAFQKKDIPFAVSQYASLFWIHGRASETIRSIKEIPAGHGERFKPFFHECLKRGLYLAPSGYEVGFVSYAHTEEQLAEAVETMTEAAIAALSV